MMGSADVNMLLWSTSDVSDLVEQHSSRHRLFLMSLLRPQRIRLVEDVDLTTQLLLDSHVTDYDCSNSHALARMVNHSHTWVDSYH